MSSVLLALDAGNSKTDIVAVGPDGRLLARLRQGGFRPHVDGDMASLSALRVGVEAVLEEAGRPEIELLAAYLANADLPEQEIRIAESMQGWGLAGRVSVGNDTLALLRSGSSSAVGVAVVCGAGINCVGVGADGATVRFPALGPLSGDWGGGHGLATETMFLACRGEDGRGQPTALSAAVAEHFSAQSATAVGIGMHLGQIPESRLYELTPVLFAVADAGDAAAIGLVHRQADEVLGMAGVALRRLGLASGRCEVVLGGGVLAAGHRILMDPVRAGLLAIAPDVRIVVPDVPPVVGAMLLGSDGLYETGVWTGDRAATERQIRLAF